MMSEGLSLPLHERSCKACRGDLPALKGKELKSWADQVPQWSVEGEHHLERKWQFSNFREALNFVNEVGEVAETQGHHPDISFSWGWVSIQIWTHKIDALTESDFILAAHLDRLGSTSGELN